MTSEVIRGLTIQVCPCPAGVRRNVPVLGLAILGLAVLGSVVVVLRGVGVRLAVQHDPKDLPFHRTRQPV